MSSYPKNYDVFVELFLEARASNHPDISGQKSFQQKAEEILAKRKQRREESASPKARKERKIVDFFSKSKIGEAFDLDEGVSKSEYLSHRERYKNLEKVGNAQYSPSAGSNNLPKGVKVAFRSGNPKRALSKKDRIERREEEDAVKPLPEVPKYHIVRAPIKRVSKTHTPRASFSQPVRRIRSNIPGFTPSSRGHAQAAKRKWDEFWSNGYLAKEDFEAMQNYLSEKFQNFNNKRANRSLNKISNLVSGANVASGLNADRKAMELSNRAKRVAEIGVHMRGGENEDPNLKKLAAQEKKKVSKQNVELGKNRKSLERIYSLPSAKLKEAFGYLQEKSRGTRPKRTVHAYDVDETIFTHGKGNRPNVQVHVKDSSGKRVQSLTNQEFNTHKLAPGHDYDFSEFRSAKKFKETSSPNKRVVKDIKRKEARGHNVHLITARAKFDDPKEFHSQFKKHGLKVPQNKIHYTGGMKGPDIGKKKLEIAKNLAKRLDAKKIHMYDDAVKVHKAFQAHKTSTPSAPKIKTHLAHPTKSGEVVTRSYQAKK